MEEPKDSEPTSDFSEAVESLAAKVTHLEERLVSEESSSIWTTVVGAKISITSVVALISSLFALTLSIHAVWKSRPEQNISELIAMEPYPTYYWYATCYSTLSDSVRIPQASDVMEKMCSQIKTGDFRDRYIPYVRLVNEGTQLYAITHIQVEYGDGWEPIKEDDPIAETIFSTFKDEKKYPNSYFFPATADAELSSPAFLERGKVLTIYAKQFFAPKPKSKSQETPSNIAKSDGSIKFILYSFNKRLITAKGEVTASATNISARVHYLGAVQESPDHSFEDNLKKHLKRLFFDSGYRTLTDEASIKRQTGQN